MSLWVNSLFYRSNTSGEPEDRKKNKTLHHFSFTVKHRRTQLNISILWLHRNKQLGSADHMICFEVWTDLEKKSKMLQMSGHSVFSGSTSWLTLSSYLPYVVMNTCQPRAARRGVGVGDPEGTDPSGGLWQWRLKWKKCGQTSQTAKWFSSFRASIRSVRKYGWSTNWARWRFICSVNKPMMSSWSSTLPQREPNESCTIQHSIHETTYWHTLIRKSVNDV